MRRRIRTMVVVLSALVSTAMAVAELTAQETHYLGGAVKGIQVKTNPSIVFTDNHPTPAGAGPFGLLPSSELTVHVNAGGERPLRVQSSMRNAKPVATPARRISLTCRLESNGLVRGVLGGPAILQPQRVPTFLWPCQGPVLTVVAKSWVSPAIRGERGSRLHVHDLVASR